MIKELENKEDQLHQIYVLTQKYHPYSPDAGSYEVFRTNYTLFMNHDRVRVLTAYQNDQIVAVFLPMSLEGMSMGMIQTVVSAECPRSFIDELLTQSIDYLKGYSLASTQIIGRDLDPSDYLQVIEDKGFVLKDQSFLSEYPCHQAIPQRFLDKKESFYQQDRGQCLTLDELKIHDPEWKRNWYEFEQTTLLDVPSEIPMEKMRFEDWEETSFSRITPDHCVLFLMIHHQIVGLINALKSGNVYFIEFTGVAADYRRQGFSSLLKVELIHHAQKEGITAIRTMNHQANPMYGLNQAFGFKLLETQKAYALELK